MANILVIDDTEDVGALIADILKMAGHEVRVAHDGVQGINLQREAPAQIVICDILMPEKEGIETIHDLKQEFPAVKIIAMSGRGHRRTKVDPLLVAQELGADFILRKPFGEDILLETVEKLLSPSAR